MCSNTWAAGRNRYRRNDVDPGEPRTCRPGRSKRCGIRSPHHLCPGHRGSLTMSRRPTISTAELATLCVDLVPVRVLCGREGARVVVSTPSGPRDLSQAGQRLKFKTIQEAAECLSTCGVLRFEVDLTRLLT